METNDLNPLTLAFTVPEEFDAIDLQVGLDWIAAQLKSSPYPQDERGGMKAYHILLTIQHQYMEKCGHPEWKEPALPEKIPGIR